MSERRRRSRLWWWALTGATALFLVAMVIKGSGITARRTPWPGEVRVAKAAWRFLVPTDIRDTANPVPATPEVLNAALEHFADHCATCHGNDGSGDTSIGRSVFPPAPDMRAGLTQQLTDGELFYAIEQGIPWTAMPAWGNGTPEGQRQTWELVRFIRHLPALTEDELSRMEQFNPRSAAAQARDREIDEFLRGELPRKGGK
jgi:mono/diheme cytochrome c family protein